MATSVFAQDQFKYTTIAHSGHLYCSPLSPQRAAKLLAALQLPVGALVLDAGCGKAGLLRQLLTTQGVCGIGVDINPYFLAEAADAWAASHPGDQRLTLVEQQVANLPLLAAGYDAILCIGASYAFGGFEGCLTTCMQWLKPGGLLLLGESYWKQAPAEQYLALLEATADELGSHVQTAERAQALGFNLRRATLSSADEWHDYESRYCQAMLSFVDRYPDDPDAAAFGERARRWYDNYLAFGKSTLGFGYYLLEKPAKYYSPPQL